MEPVSYSPTDADHKAQDETQWAIVELMGHVRLAGRLSELEKYGGKLARLDIPQPDGAFITKLLGVSAVYEITFVSEQVARHVAGKSASAAPVQPWEFPKSLPVAVTAEEPEDMDDENDPDLDERGRY